MLDLSTRCSGQAADGTPEALLEVNRDITACTLLEQVRDELLFVAHDLKTPLATMRGHVELARERLTELDPSAAAPLHAHLQKIDGGVTRMARAIDDLLDLVLAQHGQPLSVKLQLTDLVALVHGVVAQYTVGLTTRIRVQTALPALEVPIDAARIERVVGNLLSNALKYGRADDILLHLWREDGPIGTWAVLACANQGPGIPAADLPHIFERFHRARNVVGRLPGKGIGLASVHQIVAAHGGTVSVESKEGHGAIFTVRLPL